MKRHLLKPLFFSCLLILATFSASQSSEIVLQWDPNTDTDLAGYKVYYKADSSELPFDSAGAVEGAAPIDVKNLTTATVSGLEPGRTYYFAVTAYNTAGQESSYSNIVSEAIPQSDSTAPDVVSFSIPSTATSFTIPIMTFTASDNVGVSGYLLTPSADTIPSASDAGWSATAPSSYNFSSAGSKSLYAWAKDCAGNISNAIGRTVTISLPDTATPVVSAFAISATSSSMTVPITAFSASDNVGITGFNVTESPSVPAVTAASWSASAASSYTFSSAGSKTLYAWARDAAGNVSASRSATVTITLADTTEPTVSITSPNNSSTVSGTVIVTANATDNVAVAKVELYINDVLTKTDTASPFSFTWDTTSIANGGYSLSFIAYDLSGNSKTSTVSVTVSNKRSVIKRRGDLNGDGKINVTDALLALRLSVGLTPQTVNSMEAGATDDGLDGDVAPLDTSGAPLGDGRVNISDALVLLKHSVGLASW